MSRFTTKQAEICDAAIEEGEAEGEWTLRCPWCDCHDGCDKHTCKRLLGIGGGEGGYDWTDGVGHLGAIVDRLRQVAGACSGEARVSGLFPVESYWNTLHRGRLDDFSVDRFVRRLFLTHTGLKVHEYFGPSWGMGAETQHYLFVNPAAERDFRRETRSIYVKMRLPGESMVHLKYAEDKARSLPLYCRARGGFYVDCEDPSTIRASAMVLPFTDGVSACKECLAAASVSPA